MTRPEFTARRSRPHGGGMTKRTSSAEKARYAFLHEVGVCAVTGMSGEVHAAHIRGPDSYFKKPLAGTGQKPHWVWTLPLSPDAHAEQHRRGERTFWDDHGYPWGDISAGPLAAALVLEGFRQLGDVAGAQRWLALRARRTDMTERMR